MRWMNRVHKQPTHNTLSGLIIVRYINLLTILHTSPSSDYPFNWDNNLLPLPLATLFLSVGDFFFFLEKSLFLFEILQPQY